MQDFQVYSPHHQPSDQHQPRTVHFYNSHINTEVNLRQNLSERTWHYQVCFRSLYLLCSAQWYSRVPYPQAIRSSKSALLQRSQPTSLPARPPTIVKRTSTLPLARPTLASNPAWNPARKTTPPASPNPKASAKTASLKLTSQSATKPSTGAAALTPSPPSTTSLLFAPPLASASVIPGAHQSLTPPQTWWVTPLPRR